MTSGPTRARSDTVNTDLGISRHYSRGNLLDRLNTAPAADGIDPSHPTIGALVAGVFTRDFVAAHRLARDFDAGQVYINEYFAGGIEVHFGGNRGSGFGREKGPVNRSGTQDL